MARFPDEIAPPAWLVPHQHPERFKRQALGVRFRWPGLLGWGVALVSLVGAGLLGWPLLASLPVFAVILSTGVLTNPGKLLAGSVLALAGLALFNLITMVLLVAGLWGWAMLGMY